MAIDFQEAPQITETPLNKALGKARELGWKGRFLDSGINAHRDRLDKTANRVSAIVSDSSKKGDIAELVLLADIYRNGMMLGNEDAFKGDTRALDPVKFSRALIAGLAALNTEGNDEITINIFNPENYFGIDLRDTIKNLGGEVRNETGVLKASLPRMVGEIVSSYSASPGVVAKAA